MSPQTSSVSSSRSVFFSHQTSETSQQPLTVTFAGIWIYSIEGAAIHGSKLRSAGKEILIRHFSEILGKHLLIDVHPVRNGAVGLGPAIAQSPVPEHEASHSGDSQSRRRGRNCPFICDTG